MPRPWWVSPQLQRKAKELVARSVIERYARHYGEPRSISAIDALTEEVHRTQGHVDWLGQQVAARPQDANLLTVYTAERGHLAKLAGEMVSGKLDEQRSLLSEQAVEQLWLSTASCATSGMTRPMSTYGPSLPRAGLVPQGRRHPRGGRPQRRDTGARPLLTLTEGRTWS